MAGLSRNRGQLLIIGALAIAVLILGLGTVFNSTFAAEQSAETVDLDAATDAEEFEYRAHRGVGGIVRSLNYPEAPSRRSRDRLDGTLPKNLTDVPYSVLRNQLDAEVGNWSGLGARLDAVETRATRTELVDATNGSRIAQYEHRNATNQSGTANWTLATNASGVRQFRMNLSQSSLADCSSSSCFEVVLENTTSTWTVAIGNQSGDVGVAVTGPNGTQTCTASGSYVLVDLTAGTVGSDDCGALDALETADPPYTVRYRNGDRAAGRYDLVVNATVAEQPHYQGAGGPEVARALYDAEVRLQVRTHALTYRTIIRVAPGELHA